VINCWFYRFGVEDHEHLFFRCSYSRRIWRDVMRLCEVENPLLLWDEVILEGFEAVKR
jgi:hypothetical protein